MAMSQTTLLKSLRSEERTRQLSSRLHPSTITPLLEVIDSQQEGWLVARAICLAARIPTPRAMDAIDLGVRHKNPLVRIAAAGALRSMWRVLQSMELAGSNQRYMAVISALLKDPDPDVRKVTMQSVLELGILGSVEDIYHIAEMDECQWLREQARDAVKRLMPRVAAL